MRRVLLAAFVAAFGFNAHAWAGDDALSSVAITVRTDQIPSGTHANAHVPYWKLMDGTADGENVAIVDSDGELHVQTTGTATVSGTVTVQDGGGAISVDDNGGTISIDDGAGSITVDGTVAITGSVTVTDGAGALNVICDTGCAGGTQYLEDAASGNGDSGNVLLTVRNDAGGALAGTTGDYAALQTDANGALYVTGGGGGTEYTEDAASAANPVGHMLIGRRRDTLNAAEVSTDGDNIALSSTAKGELNVKQTDAVPVTDNSGSLTVDNNGTWAAQVTNVTAANLNAAVVGSVAADAAGTSTNPVIAGWVARTADPTAVTAGDAVYPLADRLGRLIGQGESLDANWLDACGTSTTTATTLIKAGQGAGTFIVVTDIIIDNQSDFDTHVFIKDGTTNRITFPAPGLEGGVAYRLGTPIKLADGAALQFASFDSGIDTMSVCFIGYKSSI